MIAASLANGYKLTHERELELSRLWRDHRDRTARDLLFCANLPTVALVARRYRGTSATIDELICEGSFGLLHALEKFDPERGVRLSSYAVYWIRSYIGDHVARSRCLVNTGRRSKMVDRLRRERRKIACVIGDAQQIEAHCALALGVSETKVRELSERIDGYDLPISAVGNVVCGGWLVAPDVDAEAQMLRDESARQASATIRAALNGLDTRERYIVEHRLLAHDEERPSLAQVGRDLGVSRERARQLEQRAKGKLEVRCRPARPAPT